MESCEATCPHCGKVNQIDCRSRKLDLNAFSGKIVGVKIKHTRRSRGKLMVRKKVARL
jgi:hypothetical protein